MDRFNQFRKVTIGNNEFDFKNIDFDFEVKKNNEKSTNIATVRIYNLSDATHNSLKKGDKIKIEAGYEKENGTIFLGVIDKAIERFRENNETISLVEATTNNSVFKNFAVDKTFNSGKKTSEIIRLIVSSSPFKIGALKLKKDVTYSKGKTFSTTLSRALTSLSKDAKSKLSFTESTINVVDDSLNLSKIVVVNAEKGLMSAVKNDEKVSIKTFLDINLSDDVLVEVFSKNVKGEHKILQVTHKANDKDFTTEAIMKKV